MVFDANRCSAMPTACQKCGCSEIEYDQARADAVCTGCGCVLEESLIVSEVKSIMLVCIFLSQK